MSLSLLPPLASSSPPFSHPGLLPTHTTVTTLLMSTQTSGSNPPGPGNPLANAALYLYTFLATLVLLVGISLFIIIRSIVQRRRRQRAIREAWLRYTNGSIPFREGDLDLIRFVEFRMNQSAVGGRGGRVDLTKMPSLWEVHLPPKKSIDSEKTAEGKFISSSWKLHQRSNPHLDLKSSLSSWSWSSILPLSTTFLLSDQASISNEDGFSPTMPVNLNGRRSTPLNSVGRLFGRMIHGYSPATASGQGTQAVNDRTRPDAPASAIPSTTANNPTNPIEGSTPSASRLDNPNPHRTDTDTAGPQLEEGTLHTHGSSGSSSASNSRPHNSKPSMGQTPFTTLTSTSKTTERADSGSTLPQGQRPGQLGAGAHISPNIPSNPSLSRNQIQNSNQSLILAPHPIRHQNSSSGTGIIDGDKPTRMRVAVLVRMPGPPRSGLSKAESKAKAESESGYEPKSSLDKKRISSKSSWAVGGVDQTDDTGGVHVPTLEVGLVDVDVYDSGGGGQGGGW